MKLFEVFLAPGASVGDVLAADVLKETGAQVFSPAEAELVGLEGIPPDPQNRPRAFIACGDSDSQFITSRLEANGLVATFRLHDI